MDPNTTTPIVAPPTPASTQAIPSAPASTQPVAPTISPYVPPTSIEPYDKNKKIVLFSAIFLAITILVIALFFTYFKRGVKSGTGVAPSILQNIATTDLSKYDQDTDSDGYPDFIETELGLNPIISEYASCKQGDCADSGAINTPSVAHNVLVILDASGSMAQGGTPNRMEVAKQAIQSYVQRAASNTQIGFMIYGHKGSNSESDKPASCASADVISAIGSVTTQSLDPLLATVRPVGWTPMGFALQQASSAFAGKEGQNNEIILLSDGVETCDSNPTGQATTLKNSPQKITINVIGFAVDSAAQTQLNQISTNGGGTFAVANNLTELDRKFSELYENGLKKYAEIKCSVKGVDTFRTCYNASFNKVVDWVQKRKLLLYEKEITQAEYDRLEALSTVVYAQQKDITNKETQNALDKFK